MQVNVAYKICIFGMVISLVLPFDIFFMFPVHDDT